ARGHARGSRGRVRAGSVRLAAGRQSARGGGAQRRRHPRILPQAQPLCPRREILHRGWGEIEAAAAIRTAASRPRGPGGGPASQSGERYGRADTRQGRERMKAVALEARRGERPMSGAGLRHLARAINWAESATPEVGEDTMARETSRAVFACVSILLV